MGRSSIRRWSDGFRDRGPPGLDQFRCRVTMTVSDPVCRLRWARKSAAWPMVSTTSGVDQLGEALGFHADFVAPGGRPTKSNWPLSSLAALRVAPVPRFFTSNRGLRHGHVLRIHHTNRQFHSVHLGEDIRPGQKPRTRQSVSG